MEPNCDRSHLDGLTRFVGHVAQHAAQRHPSVGQMVGQTDDRDVAAIDPLLDQKTALHEQTSGFDDVLGLELVEPSLALARADKMLGPTRSTMSRM